ncbi:MAG: hypothetical protein Q7T03_07100 [Deltaproteobacteria bacterium]|nr:hypothetical protein [Deltaproteobacteria bacterium]
MDMQSIQTSHVFSLSEVKPLEGLLRYREFCLNATKKALAKGATRRNISPINGVSMEPWGNIGGLEYLRCPASGSLFLAEVATSEVWKKLLAEVAQFRRSPQTFHADITKSRTENVFEPKLHWIQSTLRVEGVHRPKILEVATPPSGFTAMIQSRGGFGEILSVDETDLSQGKPAFEKLDAALLLESLDRVNDPLALLKNVHDSLADQGLIFVTGLVSSGFDMMILGSNNAYLYPPDRANCFSLEGLKALITKAGFQLLEVSTPGVLDVEIVKSHLNHNPDTSLSTFEKKLLGADRVTHTAFQSFLQQSNMSSFARIVARKTKC